MQALNLNIQKLTKSISLTQAQIAQKDSEIRTLSGDITDTTGRINESQDAIGESLRELNTLDDESLAEVLIGGGTLSSFFDQMTTLAAMRGNLEAHIEDLSVQKSTLQTSKSAAERKRSELASLKQDLAEQKQGLAIARDAQNELLIQTKNKESNYQALITQKKAEEARFEQDLLRYEAQLNLSVSSGALPPAGPVLAWPLDRTSVTQYFGNTQFATQNPQIYNGHGHTGIDLRASPGTPVKAARSGTIVGTGDTDLTCRYASFGKWIFIEHDNGLSTIYAHLSIILVAAGQHVETGQLIGYSDTTGYATGPHLHFGVYATSGTKIASFPSAGCKPRMFTIPVGTLAAYLNPLTYLPPLPR